MRGSLISKRIQEASLIKRNKIRPYQNWSNSSTSVGLLLLCCCCCCCCFFVITIQAFSTTPVATLATKRLSSFIFATTRRRHDCCLLARQVTGATTRSSRFSSPRTTAAATTKSFVHDKISSSMLSLNDFLRDCKTRIAHQNQQHQQYYHWVIGNEAGDADSITSALALAHVESLHAVATTTTTTTTDMTTIPPLIPIVSIPQNDLATQRPETSLLLKLAGINSLDNLIFINRLHDILTPSLPSVSDQDILVQQQHLLTLVDHNRLSSDINHVLMEQLGNIKVVEILDHHYDEGAHIDSCPISSSRRIIAFENNHHHHSEAASSSMDEKRYGENGDKDNHNNHENAYHQAGGGALVASTCTLVAERLISIWDDASSRRNTKHSLCENGDTGGGGGGDSLTSLLFPPSLALVLLGTILLDSVNMSPAAGKGTERDAKVIARLLQGTDWSSLPVKTLQQLCSCTTTTTTHPKHAEQQQQQQQQYPDTTALFQVLQNAKFDLEFWKSLTVRDALNLDYKQFTTAESSSSSSPQQQQDKNKESNTSKSSSYTFGLSTVLMPMEDFLLKPNVRPEILSYMQQEDVDFLGIMLTFSDDTSSIQDIGGKQIRRQMVLCATTTAKSGIPVQDNLLQEIMDFFLYKQHGGDGLDIQEIIQPAAAIVGAATGADHDDGLTLRFVNQGNTIASRKIVAPIFLQFFEQKLKRS